MSRAGLIWRTVRYLTLRQAVYQVLHRLRGRARLRMPRMAPVSYRLVGPVADKPVSYQSGTFTFLNQSVYAGAPGRSGSVPHDAINWNYPGYGKLWTYNLNYFEFLNQPGMTPEQGLSLIQDFVAQSNDLKDGLEPYPTALRLMNWVQFLSRSGIPDKAVDAHLYAQVSLLRRRLEYHLAGNHLLENGFALLTGALYFRHNRWFQTAATLTRTELSTQILADGGHNERSPMYHQILLDRLLNIVFILRQNHWHGDAELIQFLSGKAGQMLGWLDSITFRNGDVPVVNDAAPNVAPTTAQIREKAKGLGIKSIPATLGESGYRLFRHPRYELFTDVGPVGPDHQPGHAHADTFSFVLYVNKQPVLVDGGTSTYEVGERRQWERSTAAHNTVEVNGQPSSEIWSGFRVGRRARVTVLTDTDTTLTARHDGYRPFDIVHERTWVIGPTNLRIIDRLISRSNPVGTARLHIHPDVPAGITDGRITVGPVLIRFASDPTPEIRLTHYEMADGFNQRRSGQCLEILFTNDLETLIILPE